MKIEVINKNEFYKYKDIIDSIHLENAYPNGYLSIRKLRFFGWKSNLCIEEHIFYIVHLSYKKEGSSYENI